MAVIKDGMLMNTEEDQKFVDEWLAKQPKAMLFSKETGDFLRFAPFITIVDGRRKQ